MTSTALRSDESDTLRCARHPIVEPPAARRALAAATPLTVSA